MEEIEDRLENSDHQLISNHFLRSQETLPSPVGSLVLLVCVKCAWYCIFCFLFQAWRERCGIHGATGRTRVGYTELKDNQSSPVTEIKKSGRDQRKLLGAGNKIFFCVALSY